MRTVLRKLGRIIAAGLVYSAQATALREGMPWTTDLRDSRARRGPRA